MLTKIDDTPLQGWPVLQRIEKNLRNSYGVDKYINKLSRGITEFPELFLQTPLSMDQKNGITRLLITDYMWLNYP